jgi:hypothetical protein
LTLIFFLLQGLAGPLYPLLHLFRSSLLLLLRARHSEVHLCGEALGLSFVSCEGIDRCRQLPSVLV